jgi:hypothetical protein
MPLVFVFDLLSIPTFGRLARIKPFWIIATSLRGMFGFAPGLAALVVARRRQESRILRRRGS